MKTKDVMIYLGGSKKSFRCDCGCNVFRLKTKKPLRYVCNACRAVWKGK